MSSERASSLDVEISDGCSSPPHEAQEQAPNIESATSEANFGVQFGKEKPQWLPLPMAPRETHLDLSLRPISGVLEAFEDLSLKAIDLGLREVLQQLSGRTIKIATMCSGTETPIVALDLLRDCKYLPCC